MGKKKGNKGGKQSKKSDDYYKESNEHHDGLELEGADAYEAEQDQRIMSQMSRVKGKYKPKDVSGGIDELYAMSGDSDSDDDDDNQFYGGGAEDESDFEEAEENEEDVRAWGGKKKHFYGGNPNETKRGEPELPEGELNEAEAEEEEGKALQKKQLEKLDDEDFFDAFAPDFDAKKSVDKPADKVSLNISQLSKKERLALFHRESPEFNGIINDFFAKMKEIQEILQPVINWANEGKIELQSSAMDYVNTKHKLSLTYCVNILTYLMFKTRNINLKLHPLTKRLVQFKHLLDQMVSLDETYGSELEKLVQDGPPEVKAPKVSNDKKKVKKTKKLKMLTKEKIPTNVEKPTLQQQDLTMDEKMAVEVYEAMKSKKSSKDFQNESESDDEPMETNQDDNDEEAEERRAITYQIAKNKGLQPKRNKLNRNPRVKHRVKYQKAKVRRKGQVREVRTETKKYAGEFSGINARVKKGVKLS